MLGEVLRGVSEPVSQCFKCYFHFLDFHLCDRVGSTGVTCAKHVTTSVLINQLTFIECLLCPPPPPAGLKRECWKHRLGFLTSLLVEEMGVKRKHLGSIK